ncbi:MAG TPA: AI-2E family transporter [Burkholderiales bacterium]
MLEPGAAAERAFYARTFALVTLALLAYLLYQMFAPFLAPIAWALFIAFLIHPLQLWLCRKLGGRESVSAALLTAATVLVLLGPLAGLATAFAAQAGDLLREVQQFITQHRPAEPTDVSSLPVVGPAIAWLREATGISLEQIEAWVVEGTRAIVNFVAGLGRLAVLGALGTVIGFVLMVFILFFAIRDGRTMFADVRALVPMAAEDRALLFSHLASVTRAMVYGTGVTAIVQGTLVAVGFALTGLASPIVFGVLATIFALVPLAGTPVVWVPATLWLALQQRWWAAGFMLGWGTFVVLIDNVLRPLLVSGRADIGTLTVFLGVLGGVAAFGPIGVFLGPLVIALVIALVRFALETHAMGER